MSRENIHNTVQQLIAAGKTKEAITFLHQQNLPAQQLTTLALIEAEHSDLQKAKLKGVISFQEERLQKNRINDKLLALFPVDGTSSHLAKKTSFLSKLLVGFLLLTIAGGVIWWFGDVQHTCPSFPKEVRNKILIIPFEKVAGNIVKPEKVLQDRINQLTQINNLSTHAVIGNETNVTMRNASLIAKNCKANVVIWGTYSMSDSLRVNLKYHFSNGPQENMIGPLIEVKDVMDLLKEGEMLKTQDDAILALCGVIAMREGKEAIAKKWFKKVKEKDQIDQKILNALQ